MGGQRVRRTSVAQRQVRGCVPARTGRPTKLGPPTARFLPRRFGQDWPATSVSTTARRSSQRTGPPPLATAPQVFRCGVRSTRLTAICPHGSENETAEESYVDSGEHSVPHCPIPGVPCSLGRGRPAEGIRQNSRGRPRSMIPCAKSDRLLAQRNSFGSLSGYAFG